MKNGVKRIFAMLLVFSMIISMVPASVFAEGEETTVDVNKLSAYMVEKTETVEDPEEPNPDGTATAVKPGTQAPVMEDTEPGTDDGNDGTGTGTDTDTDPDTDPNPDTDPETETETDPPVVTKTYEVFVLVNGETVATKETEKTPYTVEYDGLTLEVSAETNKSAETAAVWSVTTSNEPGTAYRDGQSCAFERIAPVEGSGFAKDCYTVSASEGLTLDGTTVSVGKTEAKTLYVTEKIVGVSGKVYAEASHVITVADPAVTAVDFAVNGAAAESKLYGSKDGVTVTVKLTTVGFLKDDDGKRLPAVTLDGTAQTLTWTTTDGASWTADVKLTDTGAHKLVCGDKNCEVKLNTVKPTLTVTKAYVNGEGKTVVVLAGSVNAADLGNAVASLTVNDQKVEDVTGTSFEKKQVVLDGEFTGAVLTDASGLFEKIDTDRADVQPKLEVTIEASVKPVDGWAYTNEPITFTATVSGADDREYALKDSSVMHVTATETVEFTDGTAEYTVGGEETRKISGVSASVTDAADRSASFTLEGTYVYDPVAPIVTVDLTDVDCYEDNGAVYLIPDEEGYVTISGSVDDEYFVGEDGDGFTFDGNEFTYTVKAEESMTLDLTVITDLAGNPADVVGEDGEALTLKIDRTAPEITVTAREEGAEKDMSFYTDESGNLYFVPENEDENKDSVTITITVSSNEVLADESIPESTVTKLDGVHGTDKTSFTFEVKCEKGKITEIPAEFELKDRSGNVAETVTVKSGDGSSKSGISLTGASAVKLKMDRKNSPKAVLDQVATSVTLVDGKKVTLGETDFYTMVDGKLSFEAAYTITVTEERYPTSVVVLYEDTEVTATGGVYEIDCSSKTDVEETVEVVFVITDNSGHEFRKTTSLEIDTLGPRVNVSFSNDDVKNGMYFDAARTASIEVIEPNYDETKLTITTEVDVVADETYTAESGKVHLKAEYDADGHYTLTITGTDLLGNEATVTYAEGTKAEAEFVVDTTAPALSLTVDGEGVAEIKTLDGGKDLYVVMDNPVKGESGKGASDGKAVNLTFTLTETDANLMEQGGTVKTEYKVTDVKFNLGLDGSGNNAIVYIPEDLAGLEAETLTFGETAFTLADIAQTDDTGTFIKLVVDNRRPSAAEGTPAAFTLTPSVAAIGTTPEGAPLYGGDLASFTVDISDPDSGIDTLTYTITDSMGAVMEAGTTVAVNAPSTVFSIPVKLNEGDVETNCAKITVTVTDKVGNTITKTETFGVDKKSPELTVTFDDSANSGVHHDKYYDGTRVATIKVDDANFSSADVTVTVDGTVKTLTWDGNQAKVDFTAAGAHSLKVEGTDLSGVSFTTYETDFIIDLDAPKAEVKITGDAVDGFTVKGDMAYIVLKEGTGVYGESGAVVEGSTSVQVTVTVTDAYLFNSEVKQFAVSPEDDDVTVEYNETGDKITYTKTLTVNADTASVLEYSFSVKDLVDKALTAEEVTMPTGVPAMKAADGVLSSCIGIDYRRPSETDAETPTISLTPTKDPSGKTLSENDLFDGAFSFNVNVSDPDSGIKSIVYSITDAKGAVKEVSDATLAEGVFTIPVQLTDDVNGVETDSAKITVKVTDNAGNFITYAKTFGVDTLAPRVTVSFDNDTAENGKYFDAVRTATITVDELNFKSELINIETTGTVGEWDGQTVQVTFDEGAHTMTIGGEDLAKNPIVPAEIDYGTSVAPNDFVVDLTNPLVTLTVTGNVKGVYQAPNGKFYFVPNTPTEGAGGVASELPDEDLTLTITVEDTNLLLTGINGVVDGTAAVFADEGEGKYTFTKTITVAPDRVGEIDFTLDVTDLAGRVLTNVGNEELRQDVVVTPVGEVEGMDGTVWAPSFDETTHAISATLALDRARPDGKGGEIPAISVSFNVPSVTRTIKYEHARELFNEDLEYITIKVSDPDSGIDVLKYTLADPYGYVIGSSSENMFQDGVEEYTVPVNVNADKCETDSARLDITAIDQVGNTVTFAKLFGVDGTAPRVSVSYDDSANSGVQSNKYVDGTRVATIKVDEVNFNVEKIVIDTTGTVSWDTDAQTATVTFEAEGKHTLDISGADLVEHPFVNADVENVPAEAPYEFIIDRTNPTATLTFSDNVESYYIKDGVVYLQLKDKTVGASGVASDLAKETVTMTIVVKDTNLVNGAFVPVVNNLTEDNDFTISADNTTATYTKSVEVDVDTVGVMSFDFTAHDLSGRPVTSVAITPEGEYKLVDPEDEQDGSFATELRVDRRRPAENETETPVISLTPSMDPKDLPTNGGHDLFNGPFSFTVNVDEAGLNAGIANVAYTISDAKGFVKSANVGTLAAQDGAYIIPVEVNGVGETDCAVVNVTVTDYVGNVITLQKTFGVDNKAPRVKVVYTDPASGVHNGEYFDGTRVATITVDELNFDSKLIAINAPTGTVGEWVGQTITVTFTEEGEHHLSVNGGDLAENTFADEDVNYVGYEVNALARNSFFIDLTDPTVKIVKEAANAVVQSFNGVDYYDTAVTYTVTVSDKYLNNKTESEVALTYYINGEKHEVNLLADASDANDEVTNTYTASFTVEDGMRLTSMTLSVKDNAGRVSLVDDTTIVDSDDLTTVKDNTLGTAIVYNGNDVVVDTSAPEAKITFQGDIKAYYMKEGDESIVYVIMNNPVVGDSGEIMAADPQTVSMTVTVNDKNLTVDLGAKADTNVVNNLDNGISWTGTTSVNTDSELTYTASVTVTADDTGVIPFNISVHDLAGNAPEVLKPDGLANNDSFHTREIDQGNGKYVGIASFDRYRPSSDDKEKPIITIEPNAAHTTSNNDLDLFSSAFNYAVHITDGEDNEFNSGLKSIVWTITDEVGFVKSDSRTLDTGLGYSQDITIPVSVNGVGESNSVKLTIEATDNVGNKTVFVKDFAVDNQSPRITVTYDLAEATNGTYFPDVRTARITVTDINFSAETTTITTEVTPSGWTRDGDTYTATCYYGIDGDYTFSITSTDKANNTTSDDTVNYVGDAPRAFTIDLKDPVITFEFVKDGEFYNTSITPEVHVEEHNFSENGVESVIYGELDGAALPDADQPRLSAFSVGSDMHTANVSITKDADYRITVKVVDLSGRSATAQIDKFTVDQTNPDLEIKVGGVADPQGVAYTGNVDIDVTMHDINIDTGSHSAVLYKNEFRVGQFVKVADLTAVASGQNVDYSYPDLPVEKLNDGLYMVVAKVADLAGNEVTKTAYYSVNRFGSTYTITPETAAAIGQYHQAAGDLEITEYSPVNIKEYEITVTVNNTDTRVLTEGVDFTVDQTTGSVETWFKNVYHINKSVFSQDGYYTVTVMSTDDEGRKNTTETASVFDETADFNDAIYFWVDATAPSVSIVGIEEGQRESANEWKFQIIVLDSSPIVSISVQQTETSDGNGTLQPDVPGGELTGTIDYTLKSMSGAGSLTVVVTDQAGNSYTVVVDDILITTNVFIQYINNTPALIGTGAGVAGLGALWFFLAAKKKKRKE